MWDFFCSAIQIQSLCRFWGFSREKSLVACQRIENENYAGMRYTSCYLSECDEIFHENWFFPLLERGGSQIKMKFTDFLENQMIQFHAWNSQDLQHMINAVVETPPYRRFERTLSTWPSGRETTGDEFKLFRRVCLVSSSFYNDSNSPPEVNSQLQLDKKRENKRCIKLTLLLHWRNIFFRLFLPSTSCLCLSSQQRFFFSHSLSLVCSYEFFFRCWFCSYFYRVKGHGKYLLFSPRRDCRS